MSLDRPESNHSSLSQIQQFQLTPPTEQSRLPIGPPPLTNTHLMHTKDKDGPYKPHNLLNLSKNMVHNVPTYFFTANRNPIWQAVMAEE